MDFNTMNNQNQPQYQPLRKSPADAMITAAMALGISALVSTFLITVYFPFILGGIGIIIAILSKGHEQKMHERAKIGVICSIVGIVLNLFIIGGSFYIVFTQPEAFESFNETFETFYGESFSDTYEQLTGEEFPIN